MMPIFMFNRELYPIEVHLLLGVEAVHRRAEWRNVYTEN